MKHMKLHEKPCSSFKKTEQCPQKPFVSFVPLCDKKTEQCLSVCSVYSVVKQTRALPPKKCVICVNLWIPFVSFVPLCEI